ncbi:MAG: carbonic anhydrase [Chlorobi bacterium]|jgi:carbonic anhydrase|uniref:Carbonic anhydrase family protein n=2 Tax=Chryseobacterium TaxID=59732 RepID=A0AAJ1R212_9FLAO|nr:MULTISPECIES: carbonic anhydrase family protein [Chryseobacterium]NPA10097.1 carbonic anhydrase [Chlorobiota bacterium]MCF2221272.1 carbonic anhydrase [Chryseobacterium sp. PS-8]MDN4012446.1 carbonic anhydrase family protein [Chryseobacterium gambrini]MDN4029914.1 carbonic anhydrase family protein [Chryseobacterium gambrini]QWA37390.1 carbonic anhydrase [Chryseobacterium sp. ZHDP1]
MKAHTYETQSTITPEKALNFLKEGNQRFVNNLKANRDLLEQVNATREGQWPFAVVLSCIDSRTSAELIFDQGLGDIFSIRIAGNFVNQDILGSMEFGCNVAGSKLVVVLGHTKCGALKGGLDAAKIEGLGMDNLNHLINHFNPIINDIIEEGEERSSANADLLERLNQHNVINAIDDIRKQSSTLRKLEEEGKIKIVGANYDVETGVVTWLA